MKNHYTLWCAAEAREELDALKAEIARLNTELDTAREKHALLTRDQHNELRRRSEEIARLRSLLDEAGLKS